MVPGAPARRHQVGDDRLDQHQQPAAAQALDDPCRDQYRQRRCQAAEHRAGQERHSGPNEYRTAAEPVTKWSDQQHGNRSSQYVAGVDQSQTCQTAELCDHGRQRRGEDRLIQLAGSSPRASPASSP
jgi:hypothetical protein